MELAGPLVGIAIQTAITVAITLWARSVRRKHDGLLWRLNVWAAPAGMAIWIGGSAVSGILIVRAFDAVQSADAASRATILAQSISEAMNTTAFVLALAASLYVVAVIVCIVGAIKKPGPREPTTF